jgi:hypothetical protein
MGLFEKAGFDVTAYPVAYRTLGPGNGQAWDLDPARNLRAFEIAMREWIGLAVYWATGRIDHLFPGPDAGVAKVNSSPHVGSAAAPDYSADGRPRR